VLEDALKAAEKALELAPSDRWPSPPAPGPWPANGTHSEASAMMEKALELKGNDKRLLIDKAKVLEEGGQNGGGGGRLHQGGGDGPLRHFDPTTILHPASMTA
jgi:hypothetical protein